MFVWNSLYYNLLIFRMNQKALVLAALVCLFAVPALGTFGIVIGGLTLTAAQTTVLAAGLLGAKLLGVGIGAKLASRGVRMMFFSCF